MIKTLIVALTLLAGLAPLGAHAEGSLCATGSAYLMIDSTEPTLQRVAETCHPGDIIAIPPGGSYGAPAVARLCDFTKQMPLAGGMLYCVFAGVRPSDKPAPSAASSTRPGDAELYKQMGTNLMNGVNAQTDQLQRLLNDLPRSRR